MYSGATSTSRKIVFLAPRDVRLIAMAVIIAL